MDSLLDIAEMGKRIAHFRKLHGWTQAELAGRVGISRLLISDYERGTIRLYADVLGKIALELGVSADTLVYTSPNSPRPYTPNLRYMKRLQKIDALAPGQQKALLKNIDMFLKAADIESLEQKEKNE